MHPAERISGPRTEGIGLTCLEMGDNDSQCPFWGISRTQGRFMVNIRKRSTEHTSNRLSISLWPQGTAPNECRCGNQTACKPGSVPPVETGATIIPLDRPSRDGSRDLPGPPRPTTALPACAGARSLFGLAPGGVCRAVPVARSAVRSYRTLSPLPPGEPGGGLLSVALSLGSPPAGVTRRHVVVEPGLSSPPEGGAIAQPSGSADCFSPTGDHKQSDPRNGPSRSRGHAVRPRG